MKILLVGPFGSNWVEGRADRTATAVRLAPLGLLSLAAYVEQRGHDARVHDCRGPATPEGVGEVLESVRSFGPDMVGFTAVTSSFLNADAIAAEIKRWFPHVATVVGGVHVSALRGEILRRFPAFDFVVTGEGEKALADLADGRPPGSIQGLVHRIADEVRDNGVRTDLCDLDSLPFPAYGKLDGFPRRYPAALFSYPRAPTATIVSSRGCPYECSYCDRSVYRRTFRYNSAEYLHEHLRYLRDEFGIRHVVFYDDLFTLHRRRIEELCALLRARPLGMTFNCAVRVGHADGELLAMLKSAGCWMVSLGIESGAPEILERHKAKADFHEMRATVKRIQAAGLRAKGLFIMGLPGETEATVRATTEFIRGLELDDVNMTKFTPFPGSPIYADVRREGTFDERWELMNCLNFVFVPEGIASKARMEELYGAFIRDFYTGRTWVRNLGPLMFESPHSTWRLLRHLPTFLRIRRDFTTAASRKSPRATACSSLVE